MESWFKRHPEYLSEESIRLRRDSNYREHHQALNQVFLSCGEILVRQDRVYRYPILIVYPEATPYALPSIYLLKELLSLKELDELATQNFDEIGELLTDKVKFYNHRHQMANGALCILENDHLETGSSFYHADQLLCRVRDWLGGITSGHFPPDSSEVELFAHLRSLSVDTEFLYSSDYLEESLFQGYFYAGLLAHRKQSKLYNTEHRTFYGFALNGEDSTGILQLRSVERWKSLLPVGIEKAEDLESKKEVVQSAIDERRFLRGYWFSIQKEPQPFDGLTGFLSIIGEGSQEVGLARLHRIISTDIKNLPEELLIAIRFPNRRNILEWQLFKVKKNKEGRGIIFGNSLEDFSETLLANYKVVEVVHSELFSDQSFHQRNATRANRSQLQNQAVVILGCGSLGSEVADMVAKAGVEDIVLVDKETFKAHNAVRHLASLKYIAVAKVLAVSDIIHYHNPFVTTYPIPLNLLDTSILPFFDNSAVGISTIADDNVEGFLNEQAVTNGRAVFYSRALRGGKAARLFRVIPGRDACFHCLSLYSAEENPVVTKVRADPSLPTLTNECNNPVRPASSADLKLISSLTGRLLLDYLQERLPMDQNHWIWSTEADVPFPGTQPFSLTSSFIAPHPACPYCLSLLKKRVQCSSAILDFMRTETQLAPEIETGGILLGRLTNNAITIEAASGPGPAAKKEARYFERDVNFCQEFLDQQFNEFGHVYVGEWHYHPSSDNRPSSFDLKSLEAIASSSQYNTENPVMIILSSEGLPACSVHSRNQDYYSVDLQLTN
ncbi:ThiF family adenylyltransferase [Siphonobacter curvatus]|uniref:JAB domain-containing protein n=1 Tax=Siphonobacter curvatus TaxID=2094562 RepID=A0A2S7IHV0_9BACT|nr:ThiF family adenylyltransferase [Siphonobacter curvatus]PQA55658.1 hypothetical protein C5O19_19805 [Siphonobacter curvatus]